MQCSSGVLPLLSLTGTDVRHASWVQIYGEEGVKGFYRGCTANLIRTTPAAALTFTTFELLSRHMRELGCQQREKEKGEEALQLQKASAV